MCCVAVMLASLATQAWQMLLAQGLMFGCAETMIYLSAVNVISQWFLKRRGTAFGIAVAGSGVGGLAIAPLCQVLIDKLGWQWCLRVLGFVIIATCSLGALVYRKEPPSRRKQVERRASMKSEDYEAAKKANEKTNLKKRKVKFFDVTYFKDRNFLILYIASGIGIFGFFCGSLAMRRGLARNRLTPLSPNLPSPHSHSHRCLCLFSRLRRTRRNVPANRLARSGSRQRRFRRRPHRARLGWRQAWLPQLVHFLPAHVSHYHAVLAVGEDGGCVDCGLLFVWVLCRWVGRRESRGTSTRYIVCQIIDHAQSKGGYISLLPVMMSNSLFRDDPGVAGRLGMQMSSTLIGSIAGTPIAGAILDANTTTDPVTGARYTNFTPMIMYAGFVMLFGNSLNLLIKGNVAEWKWANFWKKI